MVSRVTVEPPVFLFCVSFVVQLSALQDFIFLRLCKDHYSQEECDEKWSESSTSEDAVWVQEEAVTYVMWLSVITNVLSIIMALFLGVAMDRYSPKLVMIGPFLGFLTLHVICVVVAAVPSLPLPILYIGATLNGLSGGYPVFKSSTSSYVVSISSPKNRIFKLSVVEGMVFLGSAVGPLVLRQVLNSTNTPHDYIFLGSEAMLVIATLYILYFVPDTDSHLTPTTSSKSTSAQNDNLICSLVKSAMKELSSSVSIMLRYRPDGGRTLILLLILADFFNAIVYSAEFDLLYVYMHNHLGSSLAQFSLYLVIKNTMNGISLLGVLPLVRRFLNLSDTSLGILGGLSRAAAFTLLALNHSSTWIYLVPLLDMFGPYCFVVIRSSLCATVKPEEYGRMLTLLSSLTQTSLLVGSVLFDNVYPVLMAMGRPGDTFLLAAASMAAAAAMIVCVQWRQKATLNSKRRSPACDET